jgi:phage FluMu protein Com
VKKKLGKRATKEVSLIRRDIMSQVPRDEMKVILRGQTDDRFTQMYDMMFDPAHSSKSLATIARESRVSHMELVDAIRKYRMGEGIVRMSQHVPDVLEDVGIDAKSRDDMCAKCEGVGTILKDQEVTVEGEGVKAARVPVKCPKCKGVGTIRKAGDTAARKLIFESIGLTGKQGPLIQVNTQNNTAQVDGLEELLKMTRRPQAQLPSINAEVVKEGE